jgi:hypothetical protein
MSVFQQCLSFITDTKTSLNTQMRELERLRGQVKKAQLKAQKLQPKFHVKEREFRHSVGAR